MADARASKMRSASITSKRQRILRQSSMANRSRGPNDFRSNSRRVGGASINGLGGSRVGGSRFGVNRRLGNGVSKLQDQSKAAGVLVLNEDQEDVTPVSLLTGKYINTCELTTEVSEESNVNTSIFAAGDIFSSIGPFTRSIIADEATPDNAESSHDYAGQGDRKSIQVAAATYKAKPRPQSAKLSEEEEQEIIQVTVQETETIWMFEMMGTCVPSNDPSAAGVLRRNEDKVVFDASGRKDMFTSQAVQTYNGALKNKDTQNSIERTRAMETQAYGWDIHDTYERGAEEAEHLRAKEDHARRRELALQKFEAARAAGQEYDADNSMSSASTSVSKSVYMSIMRDVEDDSNDGGIPDEDMEKINEAATREANQALQTKILKSEELLKVLNIAELMAAQNIFHEKQSSYRQTTPDEPEPCVPKAEESKPGTAGSGRTSTPASTTSKRSNGSGGGAAEGDNGQSIGSILETSRPGVTNLWTYQLDMVSHLSVTGIAWNKRNPDIMAVAYGQTDFTKQSDGYCLCWSLKNPNYPQHIFKFPCGVTALDFCSTEPHLLALGLYDGSVCIYNVRNTENKSVMDSSESGGTHQAPVWQLKWVNRDEIAGDERGEILASVSTDGRVTQWHINKGLAHVDLMQLKPVGNAKPGTSDQGSAFMCRQVGGTCFDFSAHDSSIYIAATEDGHIHKCSCSYNEQYLSTYHGHSAPVYKVKLSPFSKGVFLSCSADWSMRLWTLDKDEAALKIQTALSPVVDICWSPWNSTVFGSVCEGRLEIWDLKQSTIDPIVKKHISNKDLTCISFAPNSSAILVGDSAGCIYVQQLHRIATDSSVDSLNEVFASL